MATYRGGYRIEIEFDDGSRGVVDFSKYLSRGGVFERFRELAYFQRFRVDAEAGTLVWGDEGDVTPEEGETRARHSDGAPASAGGEGRVGG